MNKVFGPRILLPTALENVRVLCLLKWYNYKENGQLIGKAILRTYLIQIGNDGLALHLFKNSAALPIIICPIILIVICPINDYLDFGKNAGELKKIHMSMILKKICQRFL